MATLDKPGGNSINNVFTSAVDQRIQYREAFFNWFDTFLSANWTIVFTCDGTTASSANNLPNAAAVVIGEDGTEPISYFVMRSPDDWLGDGLHLQVLVATNELTAETEPQAIILQATIGEFALVGTPTENIPTTPMPFLDYLGRQMIPWAGATDGNWASWWTDDGDVQFGVREPGAGSPFLLFSTITASGPLANGAEGALTCTIYHLNVTSPQNALTESTGRTGFAFRDDGVTITSITSYSPAGFLTNWADGLDENGELGFWRIESFTGGTSFILELKYFGYIPNVHGCPDTTPFNDFDTADGDPVVYVALGGWALPTTVADWDSPTQPFV
jgi:hypothetical protein